MGPDPLRMAEIGLHVGSLSVLGERHPRFLQELGHLALKKCNLLQGNKRSTENASSYHIRGV